jgi:hypothetical protein
MQREQACRIVLGPGGDEPGRMGRERGANLGRGGAAILWPGRHRDHGGADQRKNQVGVHGDILAWAGGGTPAGFPGPLV